VFLRRLPPAIMRPYTPRESNGDTYRNAHVEGSRLELDLPPPLLRVSPKGMDANGGEGEEHGHKGASLN